MAYKTIKQDGTLFALVPVAEAPKGSAGEVKPGWKTTEGWATAIAMGAGLAAVLGLVTPEQAAVLQTAGPETVDLVSTVTIKLVGLVTTVASAFGYNLSRGRAKGRG